MTIQKDNAYSPYPKQPTRLQQSTGERKYQMNNSAPKNNTRNVVNMNNQDQNNYGFTQESSKMCLFEPRVFSDTQDIADELKIAEQL